MVARGEIWWVDLPEPDASESGYRRPMLIIQADSFNNSRIDTVLALVLTTQLRLADAPGNVLLSSRKTGLPKDSVANVSQILTIDKQFLVEKAGRIERGSLSRINEGLRLVLSH